MVKSPTPDANALRERALRLLANREHARAEMRRKLASGGGTETEIDALLDALAAAGLLSDERFAEAYVRSRISRGQGPLRIRSALQQRGVGKEVTQQALAEAEVDWEVLLDEVRIRRFGTAPPADYRERARQGRFLAQRGFPASLISSRLPDPGDV